MNSTHQPALVGVSCPALSSRKRGDLAILSDSNYLLYDQVSRQTRSQAIADGTKLRTGCCYGQKKPAEEDPDEQGESRGIIAGQPERTSNEPL